MKHLNSRFSDAPGIMSGQCVALCGSLLHTMLFAESGIEKGSKFLEPLLISVAGPGFVLAIQFHLFERIMGKGEPGDL